MTIEQSMSNAQMLLTICERLQTALANLKTTANAVSQNPANATDQDVERLDKACEEATNALQMLARTIKPAEVKNASSSAQAYRAILDELETLDDTGAKYRIGKHLRDLLDNPSGTSFIECESFSRSGEPMLGVPCKAGTLYASYFGDPRLFDGIGIDLKRPDGTWTQVALIETDLEGELSTKAWNGDDDDPAAKIVCDPCGNYTFA